MRVRACRPVYVRMYVGQRAYVSMHARTHILKYVHFIIYIYIKKKYILCRTDAYHMLVTFLVLRTPIRSKMVLI